MPRSQNRSRRKRPHSFSKQHRRVDLGSQRSATLMSYNHRLDILIVAQELVFERLNHPANNLFFLQQDHYRSRPLSTLR